MTRTPNNRIVSIVLIVWINLVAVAHLWLNATYYQQKFGSFWNFIVTRLAP